MATGSQAAEIYSCKNSDGTRSYTTNPPTNDKCEERSYFKNSAQEAAENRQKQANKPAAVKVIATPVIPTPTKPARKINKDKLIDSNLNVIVDRSEQKKRDKKRSDVLLFELKSEIKNKNYFTKEILETDPKSERLLDHLEKNLHIHNQNIISIKQELARMGIRVSYVKTE